MGEHAVVYGKPALVAAVNLRMHVQVENHLPSAAGKKGEFEIVSTESDMYVRHIIQKVLDAYKLSQMPSFRLAIHSDIPSGYHLGSSAAVAVGVVSALTYFWKKVWNPIAINQLAFETEKFQHGTPSGSDNTAVTMGGIIWYRKELDFLKSIWQLPFGIPAKLNNFYLIDTGKPKETTGELIGYVKMQNARYPSRFQKIFNVNEEQTKRVITAIKNTDEQELIGAIRQGEQTLEHMGVVSDAIVPIIRKIERSGGAAKILGGGGRAGAVGYLLCYHPERKRPETIALSYGYGIKSITLGGAGVKLEKNE